MNGDGIMDDEWMMRCIVTGDEGWVRVVMKSDRW